MTSRTFAYSLQHETGSVDPAGLSHAAHAAVVPPPSPHSSIDTQPTTAMAPALPPLRQLHQSPSPPESAAVSLPSLLPSPTPNVAPAVEPALQLASPSPQSGRDAYVEATLMALYGNHVDAVEMRALKTKGSYPKFKIVRWVLTVAEIIDKYAPLHSSPGFKPLLIDPPPGSSSSKKIAPPKKAFVPVFGHSSSWISDSQRLAGLLHDPAVRTNHPDLDALLTRLEGGLPPAEEDRQLTGVARVLASIVG